MITIAKAHKWLNKFHPKSDKTYLGPTVLKLSKDMHKAIRKGDLLEAWKLVERIPRISDGYGVCNEMAEARVACACVVCQLGYLEKTAELLKEAAGYYYASRHQEGVVRWMLGCVHWQLSGSEDNAITCWRSSIRIFESNSKHTRFISEDQINWNKELVEDMRKDIQLAIDYPKKRNFWICSKEEREGAENDARDGESVTEIADASDDDIDTTNHVEETRIENITKGKSTKLTRGYLVEWPVLAEIPAGTPYDALRLPDSQSQISQLRIDDQLVDVYSTHPTFGSQIHLSEYERYYFLRVKGDSMNLAGINHGDYVLMRRTQVGRNGDIVAVVIADYGKDATLKRFTVGKDSFFFQPESTNETHKTLEFGHLDESFHIHGVAVAVLKPSDSE